MPSSGLKQGDWRQEWPNWVIGQYFSTRQFFRQLQDRRHRARRQGRHREDHRPEEGPGQAAGRRVRVPGQGRVPPQDPRRGREHLRARRPGEDQHCRPAGPRPGQAGSSRRQGRDTINPLVPKGYLGTPLYTGCVSKNLTLRI